MSFFNQNIIKEEREGGTKLAAGAGLAPESEPTNSFYKLMALKK